MYISKLTIKGFRGFKNQEFLFHEEVNVIIGHNNAGKSSILRAMGLLLDTNIGSYKRISVDDFCKDVAIDELKANAPEIHIVAELSLEYGENVTSECASEFGINMKTVSPFTVCFAYHYILSDDKIDEYKKEVSSCTENAHIWKIISRKYIRFYNATYNNGQGNSHQKGIHSLLRRFDYQFLDAIRDVERDMFTGRNTLLHEVLDFFLDYDIKKDSAKSKQAKEAEIGGKSDQFSTDSQHLISQLMRRMDAGKAEMLKYAIKTGAAFNNATPDFEGDLTESELFTALHLIVNSMGIVVPASHNGLGYNNLIYISLLLAKMQASTSKEYLGNNAKLFPLLVIEEPEAHLHPSMQYQLLDFLKEQKDKVKQVFVTTHSTHITSSLSLDDMIILHKNGNQVDVGYPSKAITNAETKEYVERFLDATKSTMLFANKIIMVEGVAESLLLPAMAKHIGVDLDEKHIVVVNIGGRYFDRFLSIFDKKKPNSIPVKVACITDFDPMRKDKNGANKRFETCYPYEFGKDTTQYEYSSHGDNFVEKYKGYQNIQFFTQPKEHGKTLEYEIAWYNSSCKDIVTASTTNAYKIKRMMDAVGYNEVMNELRTSEINNRIKEALATSGLSDEDKRKALIASCYLNSIGKGANALELSAFIWKDAKNEEGQRQFVVPEYIKEAIEWLVQ